MRRPGSFSSVATKKRQARHRRGWVAEWLALLLLSAKGYWLVAWRMKTPVGEIDLVMRRGKILVFVEVKGRRSVDAAAEAVTLANQARVLRAAEYFLMQHPRYQSCAMRFDAVLVAWWRWPQHRVHAFGA